LTLDAVTGFLTDCKHALRLYLRTPLASFIAVVVLGIGMGVVTLFLSLYVELLLRPHPGFEQPRELVTFGPGDAQNISSMPRDLLDRIADDVSSLQVVAGVAMTQLQIDDEPDRTNVELVTRDFFPGLRPKLALGRGFTEADFSSEAEPVAVISNAYWQERFSGSPDALGTTIEIVGAMPAAGSAEEADPTEVRIVGVMSPDYSGFVPAQRTGGAVLWLPDEHGFALLPPPPGGDARTALRFSGVGRRSPNASATAIGLELAGRYGDNPESPAQSFHAVNGIVPSLGLVRELTQALRIFLGASVLLALVAAANATLFLLARAPGRRRELAIRMSVGAPLRRLKRQLVTEAATFVAIAGSLALALALWLAALLRAPLEPFADTSLDWRVLGFLGGCLLLLTALVSLSPVLGLKQLRIGDGSRQITARATLAQQIAGSVQIVIAAALASAGLAFAWQVGALMYGHPGYETENLHFARFMQRTRISSDGSRIAAPVALASGFIDNERWHAAIAALPGVTAVSVAGAVPGAQAAGTISFVASPVDPTQRVQVRVIPIDARYVQMLGLRVLDGRTPTEGEPGVALVNRALAQTLFGRDEVTGESLPFQVAGQASTEIIGVLEDLSFEHPSAEVRPTAFVTSMPQLQRSFSALIRSESTSAQLTQQLRDLNEAGAIELPATYVRPLTQLRTNLLVGDMVRAALTLAGAGLVVVLAISGFYGTQRYLVAAGRREYAIRASLGAGPRALGRLVLERGVRLGLPGLVIGTLVAFTTVAWLRDRYVPYETSALAVTAVVAGALVLLLLAASFGPSRHARRTQPAPLLRDD
jgi:predicted permease